MRAASRGARRACTRPGPAQRFGVQGAPRNQIVRLRNAPAKAIAEDAAEYQFDSLSSDVTKAALQQQPHRALPSQHKTKIIVTVGPSCLDEAVMLQLAKKGMTVVRLNMTHGDQDWHAGVIQRVNHLNEQGFNISIMIDTEGSEAHLKASDPVLVEAGDAIVFSVRPAPASSDSDSTNGSGPRHFQVSYEAFVHDVREGDYLMVDGGMVIVRVKSIEGPDVTGEVIEPGRVMSRATITLRRGKELVRGHSSMLPVVTAKDWQDIDFAVEHKADFLALSFVRGPDVIHSVRSYVDSQLERRHPGHKMEVVAKIEAYDSVIELPAIIDAADAIMVARSDLGAQIPLEDVPAVQKEIVFRCRQTGKPVIVASQLLNSMIDVPVPTRAEVADCADAVRQQADALMLSAETAAGDFPVKSVETLRNVFTEVEDWVSREKFGAMRYPPIGGTAVERISEEICTAAANLAGQLGAKAILVYTHTGASAGYVSRRRPDCHILAITDSESVYKRLTLRWGVMPLLRDLTDDPETNVRSTCEAVTDQGILESGDLVVVVSDIVSHDDVTKSVRSIQLRHIS
eukprot:jgi/Ulvmu1/8581/UM045_0023.1